MSKAADGTVYCDYIRCHLVIAPKDPSAVHFLKSDYHAEHYIAERREKAQAAAPREQHAHAGAGP